MVSGGALTCYL